MPSSFKLSLKLITILFVFLFPLIHFTQSSSKTLPKPNYSLNTNFNRNIDIFEGYTPTNDYINRKNYFLDKAKDASGISPQIVRVYLGLDVDDDQILNNANSISNPEGMSDFTWSNIVRLLYLDLEKNILTQDQWDIYMTNFLKSKFWFTESTEINDAIIFTENHQLLCHTAELLVGQLLPNEVFSYSGMTGQDHIDHATKRIKQWLDWRSRLGFSEWNSNSYLSPDITSLCNLVDFAMDEEIVIKSAMVLDQLAFGFACNYYKSRFATSMGRCYDKTRIETSRDGIIEAAWMMVGVGDLYTSFNDREGCALATSSYTPPPILEYIARGAKDNFEHKERHNIDMDEGEMYGISYTQEDMNFWWGQSGPMAPETIEESFRIMDKYEINPMTLLGPSILVDYLKFKAFINGRTLEETSRQLDLITTGVCLETANIYTYRTPHYQLSGCQDHMKGMNGMQEHIWQASLDDSAYVFTNSPGGVVKNFDQLFMGGWKPRATFYKNLGIIQYDRETVSLDGESLISILNTFTANKAINHAYFPRSNFDNVSSSNGWTFGKKRGSYVALYSYNPTCWVSDYELSSNGFKNVWIVEMGSEAEYSSFNDFKTEILGATIKISPLSLGYDVEYESPSQGKASLSWDGDFLVNYTKVDIDSYARFDNQYCYQEFGTDKTIIEYGSNTLELDFNKLERSYTY